MIMMKASFSKLLALSIAVIAVILPTSRATTIDSIHFGDKASETVHGLRIKGSSDAGVIHAEVGMLKRDLPCRTVTGKGSAVSTRFEVKAPQKTDVPLVMEVQEIHDRRVEVFGYTVLVNGHEVYFRTYEEMGAGPNHYFVRIDRKLAPGGKMEVTFRNEGEALFSLGRVWLYDDYFALAETEGTYRKMMFSDNPQVLLGEPKFDPTQHVGVTSAEYEDQLWEKMKARFEGTPFIPGAASAVLHGFRGLPDARSRIDQDLARSGKHGLPLQIAFMAGEWGVHPTGMDGLGGYFGDMKYSQIRYEPDTGLYRPTWPETPGGTTWPTWNDPQLQKFLAHRLIKAAGYFADQRAFALARGANIPTPLVCHDWGLSVGGYGDCNDNTIRDAAQDSVTLTPEDGLDPDEKFWLFRNLARVPTRTAAAYRQAVGRDAVVIDRGEIRLPADHLQDQNYFHTFYPSVHPLYDHRYAGWQTGVGPEVWTTGETSPNLPYAYYDYVRALGKLTTVNLERGFFRDNLDFIMTLYELGFQWVTPCNTRPGDADLFLSKSVGLDDRPSAPALHVERKLLDVRFTRDECPGPDGSVALMENLTLLTNAPRHRYSMQLADGAKPGRIVYRLENGGRAFEGPLTLRLTGQLRPGDENYLEVSAGPNPESMTVVRRLLANDFIAAPYWPWPTSATIELDPEIVGANVAYVQLHFRVKNKNTAGNLRLDQIVATMPWSKTSGHPGGEPWTVGEVRTLRLWEQDRAVYERMQRDYVRVAGDDDVSRTAAVMAEDGRYRTAYRYLSGEYAQVLLAKFAVRGHGQLGRYPVGIDLKDDAQVMLVELLMAGPDVIEMTLKPEAATECEVTWHGLTAGSRYALTNTGDRHFRVVADPQGGEVVGADGNLVLALEVAPEDPEAHDLPTTLSGIFAGGAPGGFMIDTQEERLWMDNPVFVPVATNAVWTRVQAGTTGPFTRGAQHLDHVEITLDASGKAREIKASYGRDAGRIKVFHPPVMKGALSNGVIELENGRRYEFGNRMPSFTKFEVEGLKPHYRNNSVHDFAKVLIPGMMVELTYMPYEYNGRLPRLIAVKKVQSTQE